MGIIRQKTFKCNARFNKTIPCEGEYIPSEGCCLQHACLFDVWIAEFNGWKVYGFKGEHTIDEPTRGSQNPEKLKRWKRRQFHNWLDTLNIKVVEELLS